MSCCGSRLSCVARRIIKAEWIRVVRSQKGRQGPENSRMGSIIQPFAASGPRSPTERPRQIPPSVKAACLKMIHEGCDLVVAARASGLRPDTLRRWLHRPELVGFIRRERSALRTALCSSNEYFLAQIRANSANAMAQTKAISLLEAIDDQAPMRRASDLPSPGVTIRILNIAPQPAPSGDITPQPRQIIDAGE